MDDQERVAKMREILKNPWKDVDLTPRERTIIRLRALGLSHADIADTLEISTPTVGVYLYHGCQKIGISPRGLTSRLFDMLTSVLK